MELKLSKNHKQIYDCIHGFIWISNYACRIIDTKYFQRLRDLKQLGTSHYVYPTAVHTRFEHSVGTYYLAGRILKCITDSAHSSNEDLEKWLKIVPTLQNYYSRKYDNKQYPLDGYICELIKIAALCHDLGHGPFSHVYDDVFLEKTLVNNNNTKFHEVRSGIMLETIINSDSVLKNIIHPDEIQFMKDLINPPTKSFGFVYQIVSNKLNDLDVDKYDYLVRDTHYLGFKSGINYFRLVDDVKVINNIICYPEQVYHDIGGIFKTRYRLHKQVYCHKAVISTQFMILDLMLKLNDSLKLTECINSNNLNNFSKLTDALVLNAPYFLNNDDAQQIIDRISRRRLYKSVGTIISKKKINVNVDFMLALDPTLDPDNILIHQVKIGFVSGNKNNPFDSIFFYNRKYSGRGCFTIDKGDSTFILAEDYQEYVTMIFSKRNDKDEIIKLRNVYNTIKDMKETLETK